MFNVGFPLQTVTEPCYVFFPVQFGVIAWKSHFTTVAHPLFRITSEVGLEIDTQQEEESSQPDESDLPSTSQDPPSSSSAGTAKSCQSRRPE